MAVARSGVDADVGDPPAHYVILEACFVGGLAGVIALTRRRDREGQGGAVKERGTRPKSEG